MAKLAAPPLSMDFAPGGSHTRTEAGVDPGASPTRDQEFRVVIDSHTDALAAFVYCLM